MEFSTVINFIGDFANNPSVKGGAILICTIFLGVAFRWIYIEDYFQFRSVRKCEKLIEATTDSSLKKLLSKKKDQEILFKETRIRQVDLAKKIMQFLTHQSLVLYRRDLNFYRYYFFLDKGVLSLKEIGWLDRQSNRIMKVLFLVVFVAFILYFSSAILILASSPFLKIKVGIALVCLAFSFIFLFMAFLILNSTFKTNYQNMQKLIEEFNKSQ